MSIKQTFLKYFNNHAETSESSWAPGLRTRYYKSSMNQAFQALENIFNGSNNYQIISSSPERGEISVNGKGKKKAFIVATVIMVRPFRTAIDFSVTTNALFSIDFGYSHKIIAELYEMLNKELTFIETSMAESLTNRS